MCFARTQALCRSFLLINILKDCDGPDDFACLVAKRRGATTDPGLASVVGRVDEIEAGSNDFSAQGSGAWIFRRRKKPSVVSEAFPAPERLGILRWN